MSYHDNIYKLAVQILAARGKLQTHNVIRVMSIYEDEKIYIDGLLPLNVNETVQSDEPFDSIYIGLKLPMNTDNQNGLRLPDRMEVDKTTMVYLWNGTPRFNRDGRWLKYLETVLMKIETERQATMTLHQNPIDDSGLFPDIE